MAKTEDGKRVTVLFNVKHLRAIEAEVKRRSRARGYEVSVSDALRELVQENWGPKPAKAVRA